MFSAELHRHLCVGSGEEEVCIQRKKEVCDCNPEQHLGPVSTEFRSSTVLPVNASPELLQAIYWSSALVDTC